MTDRAVRHRLHIVDVFAQRPYSGNQLAVVLDADDLTDETMLRIAAEMNFSETTFVGNRPEPDGGYRVRIFTPSREIAFAGHPILGTAWVIRHRLATSSPRGIHLNIPVGRVPVVFEPSSEGRDVAWFTAPAVQLGRVCDPDRIARALHLSPADIETRAPVQVLSSGVSITIVPLRSLEALRAARLEAQDLAGLVSEGFPPLVYLFCSETHHSENHLCARFFFEANGVREDAATGNGAALLGVYLLEHQYFPESDHVLRIEQGHGIQRRSLILLRARRVGTSHDVSVGGYVIPIVEGDLLE